MKQNMIRKIFGSAMLASLVALTGAVTSLTSCTDIDSNLVEFADDNKLNTPNDTLFSLVGILGKMQKIADRTILLGDVRSDVVSLTPQASLDLQEIASFKATDENPYNRVSDYYDIIQNCNYFLAHADTTLSKRGEKIFIREYAAVKAFRAWTYLQLAINYGQVPFVTKPILTEKDGNPSKYPLYDVNQMADYFIEDLAPFVDTKYPNNGLTSSTQFYPVRVLLGDYCLWSGRYVEAATYYHDYLTELNQPKPIYVNAVQWTDTKFQGRPLDSYSSQSYATVIEMEEKIYDGTISRLADVYASTNANLYFYQATASEYLKQLSRSQRYVMTHLDVTTLTTDTIIPADTIVFDDPNLRGDLRLYATVKQNPARQQNTTFNTIDQTISKFRFQKSSTEDIQICQNIQILKNSSVYLRYAEALNRAGFPTLAFAVLKYGIWYQTLEPERKYVSAAEVEAAGDLVKFSSTYFTDQTTIGIHSRGCGNAAADVEYVIPELETLQDSILFVEDRILDEQALDESFEGLRFGTLQRIALRRNAPELFADHVASRSGLRDETLYERLLDPKNWYLPLPR